jgi:hypothetical protein
MATIKYKTRKPCAARCAGGTGFMIWFLIVLRYLISWQKKISENDRRFIEAVVTTFKMEHCFWA